MLDIGALAIRIVTAAFCGGVIGYQRERKDRPAGFRTHILVSLGSALFMIVSLMSYPGTADPSRVAAQVVTGIGFLGAGTIIRQGNIIRGLTTAASLWATAAVGLAAGAAYYSAAVVGTVMIFIVLSILSFFEQDRGTGGKDAYLLTIDMKNSVDLMSRLRVRLSEQSVDIVAEEAVKRTSENIRISLEAHLQKNQKDIAEAILALDGVARVKLEKMPEVRVAFL